MIIPLLFHDIGIGKYATPIEEFREFVLSTKKSSEFIRVGQQAPFFRKNILLTFDDGLLSFYTHIFPILAEHKIPAVLAVVPSYLGKAGYITEDMLLEIARSGIVEIASHSYSHQDLSKSSIDLQKEIVESKSFLETRINLPIRTWVFPYGRTSKEAIILAKKHYTYLFRIGHAVHYTWRCSPHLYCRINADQYMKKQPLSMNSLFLAHLKACKNMF